MFDYTQIAPFLLRFAVFLILFSTYPLLTFFMNNLLLKLFFKDKEVTRAQSLGINVSITLIPLMFALFYPNIGTVLGYVGALAGFMIIYIFPVLVYLKHMRTQITNPLLAEAIAKNEF